MDECLTVTLKIPISPFTLVCIRVQWNHPDLSGVCPGCEVPDGRLLRNRGGDNAYQEREVKKRFEGTFSGTFSGTFKK